MMETYLVNYWDTAIAAAVEVEVRSDTHHHLLIVIALHVHGINSLFMSWNCVRQTDRQTDRQVEPGDKRYKNLRQIRILLYPRDSEIKVLNLSAEDVDSYMCAQRVYQNNMEFLTCFFPIMILAMLDSPTGTFHASVVVLVGRMVKGLGYYRGASKRLFGWFFHFGEWYIVYLAGAFARKLITNAWNNLVGVQKCTSGCQCQNNVSLN